MPSVVRVLFFASAREAVGERRLDWPVPVEGRPIDGVVDELVAAHAKLAPVIRMSRLVLNGKTVPRRGTLVRPGDELAIHPPYSGG